MRRGFGLVWALVTLAIVGVASWMAYGAGVAQGAAVAPQNNGGSAVYPPYYYHYGWGGPGWGFGIFPLLFLILILFLLFRRPWHWGRWRGYYGYGHGPWGGHGHTGELPPPVDDHLRAWHDRVHGKSPEAESGPQPPQPG